MPRPMRPVLTIVFAVTAVTGLAGCQTLCSAPLPDPTVTLVVFDEAQRKLLVEVRRVVSCDPGDRLSVEKIEVDLTFGTVTIDETRARRDDPFGLLDRGPDLLGGAPLGPAEVCDPCDAELSPPGHDYTFRFSRGGGGFQSLGLVVYDGLTVRALIDIGDHSSSER